MKPEQKRKGQEKKTDKAMGDLAGKKLDPGHAGQVHGGLSRLRDDESPKEKK